MKKPLLILSLFLATQGAFSNDNAGYNSNSLIATGIQDEANMLPTGFSIDLDGGRVLTGTVFGIGNHYSYIAFIMENGSVIGTVSGSYDVEVINGVEAMIEDSFTETYSNDDAAAAAKTKRDAVKNAMLNVR